MYLQAWLPIGAASSAWLPMPATAARGDEAAINAPADPGAYGKENPDENSTVLLWPRMVRVPVTPKERKR